MPHITAVILTYNRKELLRRSLDAVYAQTRPCDRVIVIDNASHDGTRQMLLTTEKPGLEVYMLSHNIGASGGFNAGFRLAYQRGTDFIWMMDDDIIPEPDALQRLLEADDLLKQQNIDHAFLLSTAFTESGFVTNTPGLSALTNGIGYRNWPALVEYGMAPVQRATFVSILVPRATLAEHGLPIASMFIWGEDTEYTLRVTRDRPGVLVGTSKVLHLRQENGPISILTENNPGRLKLHRHRIRNDIFIARNYKSFGSYLSELYKYTTLLLDFLRQAQFNKARIVLHGLVESLWFFPGTEAADTPPDTLTATVKRLERLPSASNTMPESTSEGGMKEETEHRVTPAHTSRFPP
ncbi:glycosyltransferase family 2 protein [Halomonas kalidii]|uniref:Glycosyltransferase family 2 protein n=1 Tax=Halomonas kalidii TaxID=3043293 RepID=A0ABT6VMF7_9GAMM|nr:glycosyltransferase family 2 protein [Halomonas kalidii]MDI5934699.1 glycosyltransferase family 2 protein [Halomonas kalidii]